jgi:hypothetical protein
VQNRGNAYEYDPAILDWTDEVEAAMNAAISGDPFYIQVHDSWWDSDFVAAFGTKCLMDLQQLMYSPMAYTRNEMFVFCVEHFGMHAVYFMSNFLFKIPQRTFESAFQFLNSVPDTTKVIGVHLRLQFPGQFYSHSCEQTMKVVKPFLQALADRHPTVFGFASDSTFMEAAFLGVFGPQTIQTNAIRVADYDHTSALLDLAFLQMANDCLLSFRSTFSFAVASTRGTRCWFVEKEAPQIFQIANSQAGSVSMQFHFFDVNDWQTSRRYFLRGLNLQAVRYYYKYFMF